MTTSTHPNYYYDLLRRRVASDPVLTPTEHQELDLHLLICLQCNYHYAQLLRPDHSEEAETWLRTLEARLTADGVIPYLRDLVRAIQAGQLLTGFQGLLWRFIQRDQEALGYFRLVEADEWLRSGQWKQGR